MSKKLSFILLLSFLLFTLTPLKKVYAQEDAQCLSSSCFEDAIGQGDLNYQRTTIMGQSSIEWLSVCELGGVGTACEKAGLTYEKSALGMVQQSTIALYLNPPADTRKYIADVGSNLGFVSPAYAQARGIGFSGLAPLLPIWKAFRNMAYAFLIVVMIIIGFMIMFRRKIDPRTVMTVQSALPRIVMTLILITFSYAIVGLLIDLMYLIIGVSYVALGSADPGGDVAAIATNSFPRFTSTMFGLAFQSVDDIYGIIGGGIKGYAGMILGGGAGGGIIGGVTSLIGIGGAWPLMLIGGALIAALPLLLVILATLFAMIRVFFMLLSAYIQVLISVIFGPLQIMLGAIPGNNSFGSWLRNLVANLSVFAVTAIMIVLGLVLNSTVLNPAENGQLWTPPGVAGNVGNSMAGLIGLGITLVIPNIAGAVKESLKAKSTVPIGPSMFFSPITASFGAIQQAMYFRSFKKPPGAPGGGK